MKQRNQHGRQSSRSGPTGSGLGQDRSPRGSRSGNGGRGREERLPPSVEDKIQDRVGFWADVFGIETGEISVEEIPPKRQFDKKRYDVSVPVKKEGLPDAIVHFSLGPRGADIFRDYTEHPYRDLGWVECYPSDAWKNAFEPVRKKSDGIAENQALVETFENHVRNDPSKIIDLAETADVIIDESGAVTNINETVLTDPRAFPMLIKASREFLVTGAVPEEMREEWTRNLESMESEHAKHMEILNDMRTGRDFLGEWTEDPLGSGIDVQNIDVESPEKYALLREKLASEGIIADGNGTDTVTMESVLAEIFPGEDPEDYDEDDKKAVEKIFSSDSPVEIHKNLNKIGDKVSVDTLRRLADISYRKEEEIAPPYLGPHWDVYTPFCHGTGDHGAKIIRTEGMKSRLNRSGERLIPSQWEEELWPSMLDRTYIGTRAGLGRCLEAAQQDRDGIHLFFFDNRLLELEPVMDEDSITFNRSVKKENAVNAIESAERIGSFAVRKNIAPSLITEEFVFNPFDLDQTREEIHRMAEFLGENEPGAAEEWEEDLLNMFEDHGILPPGREKEWRTGDGGAVITDPTVTDAYKGQINCIIYLRDPEEGNMAVGFLDYNLYLGKVYISGIQIHPNYRKKGFGRKMIEKLLEFEGKKYSDLEWGYTTEEGTALKRSFDRQYGGDGIGMYSEDYSDPPVDLKDYVTQNEEWEWEKQAYLDQKTGQLKRGHFINKEIPQRPFPWKLGTWRIDKNDTGHGHELAQLRMVPVDSLYPSEEENREYWVEQYAAWTLEGRQAPPIEVGEKITEDKLIISEGHRRWKAAKKLGRKEILAWVAPAILDPEGRKVPLTYENSRGYFIRGFESREAREEADNVMKMLGTL